MVMQLGLRTLWQNNKKESMSEEKERFGMSPGEKERLTISPGEKRERLTISADKREA